MQPAREPESVAIYLRVSTEEQARSGYSLAEQREACRRLARELQPDAVPDRLVEFVDTFGGDVLERPVLEELRAFVQRSRPAWFICLDPDRFSRNLGAQLLLTDEIERAGTRLAFVQHAYAKSSEGQLFYQLRGAVAQFEKAKILERTHRGKQGKIKAGRRPNGAAPFGYRHCKETDELAVHEPEAVWVRQIFHWAAVDGLSPYQIAQRLEELAVPTRLGGRRWRRSTVAAMLANTTYRGQMRCNRYDTRGLGAVRRLPRSRRRPITATLRPAAEWRVVPVPAIIEEELFRRVQQRLAATVRKGSRPGGRLLSLLVRCGACGGRMAYNLVAGRRLYLKCSRRYADLAGYSDPTRCGSRHQRAEPVEEGAWRTVTAWLLDMALHEAWLAEGTVRPGPPLASLEERRRALERQQALVVAKLAQGLLAEPVADALLAETIDQLRQVEAALAELRAAVGAPGQAPPASAAAALEQTRRHLEKLSPPMRQALVRQLVQAVILHPDGTWTVVPV